MQSSRISHSPVIPGIWEMGTLSRECHGGRWTAPCENSCEMLTSCQCCLLFLWQGERGSLGFKDVSNMIDVWFCRIRPPFLSLLQEVKEQDLILSCTQSVKELLLLL